MHRYLSFLALLLLLPAQAPASQLNSVNSSECVNVPWHGYPIDGTRVHVLQCNDRPNQQWVLQHGQIVGVGGSCLDVQGGLSADGTAVVFVTCNGRPGQTWGVADGHIVGVGGKCLDISGGQAADHATLVIATCSGAPTQQWTVQ
jgi:Ricin-type beta-trefoil lectin domain